MRLKLDATFSKVLQLAYDLFYFVLVCCTVWCCYVSTKIKFVATSLLHIMHSNNKLLRRWNIQKQAKTGCKQCITTQNMLQQVYFRRNIATTNCATSKNKAKQVVGQVQHLRTYCNNFKAHGNIATTNSWNGEIYWNKPKQIVCHVQHL